MEFNSVNEDDKNIKDYEKVLATIITKIPEVKEPLHYMVATEIGSEILDLKLSINALLNENCYAGILSLSRNMLENYIYLVYILSDDSFKRSRAYQLSIYREMEKQIKVQKKNRTLEKMREEDESFNEQIKLYDTHKESIENYLKELDSLYGHKLDKWYNDDKKTKSIWSLFNRVDKSYLYDSVYRYLCLEVHGNRGFKHLYLTEDEKHMKFCRTNLDAEKISTITSNILLNVKGELEKIL